jgi:hypothetical protein
MTLALSGYNLTLKHDGALLEQLEHEGFESRQNKGQNGEKTTTSLPFHAGWFLNGIRS